MFVEQLLLNAIAEMSFTGQVASIAKLPFFFSNLCPFGASYSAQCNFIIVEMFFFCVFPSNYNSTLLLIRLICVSLHSSLSLNCQLCKLNFIYYWAFLNKCLCKINAIYINVLISRQIYNHFRVKNYS